MKLIYLETKKEFEAEILPVEDSDLKGINKSKLFNFDLSKEENVYKIIKMNDEAPEILGLLSILDISEELRIHINLIENSRDHKGKKKKIDRIAGCLLAFAVSLSFKKGYLGFTSLVPKTELINLYVKKYGFTQYGRQLAIERNDAVELIQKYL